MPTRMKWHVACLHLMSAHSKGQSQGRTLRRRISRKRSPSRSLTRVSTTVNISQMVKARASITIAIEYDVANDGLSALTLIDSKGQGQGLVHVD